MWIRGSGLVRDWNGIHYKLGMSGKNVGATELSMNVAVIPPGGVARAHIHVGFEVMLYILQGACRHTAVTHSASSTARAISSSSSRTCPRGLQPERLRAGRRGRRAVERRGVGPHRPLRAS